MRLANFLLIPLGMLYRVGMHLRNLLYSWGIKRICHWEVKIISIGNLSLGGTGKTPLVIYLVNWLQRQHIAKRVAVLSRGYKRTTKGFKIANGADTTDTIGDEPYMLYQRFHQHVITIAVAANRNKGIKLLLQHNPQITIILLDDAFQHRSVKPDLNILLTDFNNPFFQDRMIPLGYLREPRSEAKRADMVIVTKCPTDINEQQKSYMAQQIGYYLLHQKIPILYATIVYQQPRPVFVQRPLPKIGRKVLLVTAIANATPLVDHVQSNYDLVDHITFPDHHQFTYQDIIKIVKKFKEIADTLKYVITTDKDRGRIINSSWKKMFVEIPIFYIPIEVVFTKNEVLEQYISTTLTPVRDYTLSE